MSGRHSWSLQTTDRLQDRLGDVAGSFKRQQEQQGSQTLKSDEQLSRDPSLFSGEGGCNSVAGLSNQVRRLPSPLHSGKVLVKHSRNLWLNISQCVHTESIIQGAGCVRLSTRRPIWVKLK